jgi:hypothetical protein
MVSVLAPCRRRWTLLRPIRMGGPCSDWPLVRPPIPAGAALADPGGPEIHGVVRAFLDGLLPEGDARQAIARDFGVTTDDTYGLIRAVGRDCAGALVIQPDDEPAPQQPTTLTAEPLTEVEISHQVANLRSAPLGVGGRRASQIIADIIGRTPGAVALALAETPPLTRINS